MIKIYRDKNYLQKNNTKIWKTNDDILNKIVKEFKSKDKILLFGAVQSGKTKNIINLIKKIYENELIDYIFYVVGNTNELKDQNFNRLKEDLKNIDVFNAEKRDLNHFLPRLVKDKSVIVVLKQHLSSIESVISNNIFGNKKILIIDDESDDYSLSKKNQKYFKNIISHGVGLISCTATPFLNLYFTEKIYNSYYKLIPGEGYYGIEDFDENINILTENEIKNERKLYLKSLIEWANITYKNELKSSQILFNFALETKVHDEMFDSLFSICEEIKRDKISKEEISSFNIKNIDISGVKEVIKKAQESGIKLSNGTTKSEEGHKLKNEGFEIIIGGHYLSRGITYKNLISEVLLNISDEPMIQTIIQRSRWCGYRQDENGNDFKHLMKIYISKSAQEAFNEIDNIYKMTLNHSLNSEISYKEKAEEISSSLGRVKM